MNSSVGPALSPTGLIPFYFYFVLELFSFMGVVSQFAGTLFPYVGHLTDWNFSKEHASGIIDRACARRRWLRDHSALPPAVGSAMTIFHPATPISNAIVRPPCPQCDTMMLLARIEPDKPGHETRTFECPKCQHSESTVIKFR